MTLRRLLGVEFVAEPVDENVDQKKTAENAKDIEEINHGIPCAPLVTCTPKRMAALKEGECT